MTNAAEIPFLIAFEEINIALTVGGIVLSGIIGVFVYIYSNTKRQIIKELKKSPFHIYTSTSNPKKKDFSSGSSSRL